MTRICFWQSYVLFVSSAWKNVSPFMCLNVVVVVVFRSLAVTLGSSFVFTTVQFHKNKKIKIDRRLRLSSVR